MIKKIFLILIAASVFAGCSLPLVGKKQAALQITSSPAATVFLNANHVGGTPFFDDNLKPGDYKIKLASESGQEWETQVTLKPKFLVVINRTFGPTAEESSYYLLQLEKLTNDNATELTIVTIPDSAIVKIDDQPKGFAPISLDSVTAGDRAISLAAPGYKEMEIQAKVQKGYKLTVSAQLARDKGLPEPEKDEEEATESGQMEEEATPTPSPTAVVEEEEATEAAEVDSGIISGASSASRLTKPYVKIVDTGTGWLRVHSGPTPGEGNEVAKVKVGTYFKITDQQSGWYEIEYKSGKKGWIVSRYAELTE